MVNTNHLARFMELCQIRYKKDIALFAEEVLGMLDGGSERNDDARDR